MICANCGDLILYSAEIVFFKYKTNFIIADKQFIKMQFIANLKSGNIMVTFTKNYMLGNDIQ
jgi:Tfp pilus assembly protein PilZ